MGKNFDKWAKNGDESDDYSKEYRIVVQKWKWTLVNTFLSFPIKKVSKYSQ